MYPFFYFLFSSEKYYPQGFQLMRFQAKWIIYGSGIFPKVEMEAEFPESPFILCSNHTSYLDVLMMYAICDKKFISLGKKELGDLPLFNIYFKTFNILVNRENPKESSKAISACAERIDKDWSVVIYPEGTISRNAPTMKAFKNGAFKLAIDKKVPIVPISFQNNYKLLSAKPMSFYGFSRPGFAKVYIHKKQETTKYKPEDFLLLSQEIKEIIASKI